MIVQPFSSLVVVTVRPFSSVWEETARAFPPEPDEDDDTLTEEWDDREPDEELEALAWPVGPTRTETEDSLTTDLISFPFARIRTTRQLVEELGAAELAAPAANGTAAKIRAIAGTRSIDWLLGRAAARSQRDRAVYPTLSCGACGAFWLQPRRSSCHRRRPASRYGRSSCRHRLPNCCSRCPNRWPCHWY